MLSCTSSIIALLLSFDTFGQIPHNPSQYLGMLCWPTSVNFCARAQTIFIYKPDPMYTVKPVGLLANQSSLVSLNLVPQPN